MAPPCTNKPCLFRRESAQLAGIQHAFAAQMRIFPFSAAVCIGEGG